MCLFALEREALEEDPELEVEVDPALEEDPALGVDPVLEVDLVVPVLDDVCTACTLVVCPEEQYEGLDQQNGLGACRRGVGLDELVRRHEEHGQQGQQEVEELLAHEGHVRQHGEHGLRRQEQRLEHGQQEVVVGVHAVVGGPVGGCLQHVGDVVGLRREREKNDQQVPLWEGQQNYLGFSRKGGQAENELKTFPKFEH